MGKKFIARPRTAVKPDLDFLDRRERSERITAGSQLRSGDEVRWCTKLHRLPPLAPRWYDPHLPAFYDRRPEGLTYGIVLRITKNNGVLIYVTSRPGPDDAEPPDDIDDVPDDGIIGRKHFVPLARIWNKTGYRVPAPPDADDLDWADPDIEWYAAQRRSDDD